MCVTGVFLLQSAWKGVIRMSISTHLREVIAAGLLLLCASIAASAQATSSVSGRVLDPKSGGISGAIVTIYSRESLLRLSTASDAGGNYRFLELAPGDYFIEADASGFAPAPAQVLHILAHNAVTLDLHLDLAGIEEQVIVTASSSAQTTDELSKSTSVITGRELDERDEISIPESLRVIPGLRVQQLGGPASLVSIKSRGLPNQDTAVLLDGFRFRDASAPQGDASGLLNELLVTDTNQVEVLRGSGSSLYGTNAIGGVINITTDEGGGPIRGNLLAEGGGLGLFRGRAQLAGGADHDRFIYSAGISHLNISRDVSGRDHARITALQGRTLFRLSPTAYFSARLFAADSYQQLNTDPQAIGNIPPTGVIPAIPITNSELSRFDAGVPADELNVGVATFIPAAFDPDNSAATRLLSGALSFTHTPSERFDYSISYQGLLNNGSFRNGPAGPGFQPSGISRDDFDGRIHTLEARADVTPVNKNLLTFGYEFEHERFFNRSQSIPPMDEYEIGVAQNSQAIYAQDQSRLVDDRLSLSAGFRMQLFRLDQPQFNALTGSGSVSPYQGFPLTSPPRSYTGDGSIAYTIRGTGTKFRGHGGNSYRAPSLYERFGSYLSGGYFSALGDPRLQPERSVSFDAGVDQVLGKKLRASATYFYTRLQETIVFGNTPQPDPFGRVFGGYLNAQGGLARGVELSADSVPLRSLELLVAYTYTNSSQRVPLVEDVLRSFVIPNHQFAVVATEHITPRLYFTVDFNATSNYLAPLLDYRTFLNRVYRFSGQARADLGASYTVPLAESRTIRFFTHVENIFGQQYYENGFLTPGITGRAGVSFGF